MLYRLLSFFVVFKSLPNELHEVDLRHSSGLVLLMRILVCNGLSFPLVPKLPVAYKICRHISRRRSVEEFSFLEANVAVFYIIFFSVVKGAVPIYAWTFPVTSTNFALPSWPAWHAMKERNHPCLLDVGRNTLSFFVPIGHFFTFCTSVLSCFVCLTSCSAHWLSFGIVTPSHHESQIWWAGVLDINNDNAKTHTTAFFYLY